MDIDEIVADSEEEQEDTPPKRDALRSNVESTFNNSISEINNAMSGYASVSSPQAALTNGASSPSAISSLGPPRNSGKISPVSSILFPAPLNKRNRDLAPTTSYGSITTPPTQTTASGPVIKPRPKPRRKVWVEETSAPSSNTSLPPTSSTSSTTGTPLFVPTASVPDSTKPVDPGPSRQERVPPKPPVKRPSEPEAIIHILTSDEDTIVIKQVPKKKKKVSAASPMKGYAGASAMVSSGTSTAKRKEREVLPAEIHIDDEDDPMRLTDSAAIRVAENQLPRFDDGRFSDFDPGEPPSRPKAKKKSKIKDPNGEGKSKKRKESESRQDIEQLSISTKRVKESFKSNEFIQDSDEESRMPPNSKSPHKLLSSEKKRKAVDESDTKKKKKKRIIPPSDEEDNQVTHMDNDSLLRSQRSSARVAIAMSKTSPGHSTSLFGFESGEEEPHESVGSPRKPTTKDMSGDKPRENKKRKKRKEIEATIEQTADDTKKVEQQPIRPLKPRLAATVEVVLPIVRRDSAKENKSPHTVALTSTPKTHKSPESEGPTLVAPTSEPRLVSTVPLSTPGPVPRTQSKPRTSLSSYRRPNKPLTALLGHSNTPASTARPSGLSKFTRIAPLHAKRKSPPPRPPPIPNKRNPKKNVEDGEDSDGDWGETRGTRIKRLVREFEDLEGIDSKKANDRRKEIESEIATISGGY